jgi:hypothetical protein
VLPNTGHGSSPFLPDSCQNETVRAPFVARHVTVAGRISAGQKPFQAIYLATPMIAKTDSMSGRRRFVAPTERTRRSGMSRNETE